MRSATKDVYQWQQRWRQTFAAELLAATGRAVLNGFDWHVFSFGHHAAVAGWPALHTYANLPPCAYVVLGAWEKDAFGARCSGQPPNLKTLDVLVMPETVDWTMAFTHEADLGPYFAEASPAPVQRPTRVRHHKK